MRRMLLRLRPLKIVNSHVDLLLQVNFDQGCIRAQTRLRYISKKAKAFKLGRYLLLPCRETP
jgi:hypothetical protein